MQTTTASPHHETRDSIASVFLLAAGIIVLIASADALAALTAAVMIASLVWGLIREIQRHVHNRAELAPLTHLRSVRQDAKMIPPQLLRHAHNAA